MTDVIDQAQANDELFRETALRNALAGKKQGLRPPKEERLCEDCGEPIPVKRLKANPVATRCVTCQTLAERSGFEDE